MNIGSPLHSVVLRMPFPALSVLFLVQGNYTTPPQSHSNENCLHALDFTGLEKRVVAAREGEVVETFTTAIEGNFQDGFGFGNYIKILHVCGLYTFYAHMDEVSVEPGDIVSSGTFIGTYGCTGWTKMPHLHFSLHQGAYVCKGVPASSPFEKLLTLDVAEESSFAYTPSYSLIDAGAYINPSGHYYASENDPQRVPLVGRPAQHAMDTIHENYKALEQIVVEQPEILQPHFNA